jgi:hypothetical protein
MQREEFCRTVGLPCDRRFILFAGSSSFIGSRKYELPFLRRWLKALRTSDDPVLRDAAVLLRPYPSGVETWVAARFTNDLHPVSVWPQRRYTPAAADAQASLFDSIYHCDAVVAVNTTVMLEAAIQRKPVLSVLSPEFLDVQMGTKHFHYLLPGNGGFLRVADSIDVHLKQLSAALRDPTLTHSDSERFVESFIRPHGLATPCTPILADAIATQASTEHHPATPRGLGSRVLRMLLWPLAAMMALADGNLQPRPVVGEVRRAIRTGARRGQSLGGRAIARLGRAVRRVPRLMLRNIRHARYYIATVFLQRPAK